MLGRRKTVLSKAAAKAIALMSCCLLGMQGIQSELNALHSACFSYERGTISVLLIYAEKFLCCLYSAREQPLKY